MSRPTLDSAGGRTRNIDVTPLKAPSHVDGRRKSNSTASENESDAVRRIAARGGRPRDRSRGRSSEPTFPEAPVTRMVIASRRPRDRSRLVSQPGPGAVFDQVRDVQPDRPIRERQVFVSHHVIDVIPRLSREIPGETVRQRMEICSRLDSRVRMARSRSRHNQIPSIDSASSRFARCGSATADAPAWRFSPSAADPVTSGLSMPCS